MKGSPHYLLCHHIIIQGFVVEIRKRHLRLDDSILVTCIDTVVELVLIRCKPANNVHCTIFFTYPFHQAAAAGTIPSTQSRRCSPKAACFS